MTAFVVRTAVAAAFMAGLASSGAQAAASFNGHGLNGMNMQGVALNGVNMQGVSLNGENLNGTDYNGAAVGGLRQPVGAARLTVEAVILPSGETVHLR